MVNGLKDDLRSDRQMRTVNSYIGAPLKRFEDFRFLTGRGQYVGDLKRERLLHAVILRSPVAHGTIAGIDATRARAMPGVRAVITAADIGSNVPRIPMRQEPMPELLLCEQPVIAQHKVRYVGEPVAVVVAESVDIAEDAAQAIELSIDPLPAVVGREQNVLVFDAIPNNVATAMKAQKGDAAAAFVAHGSHTRRERFAIHRHTAVALEPRGLMAEWDETTRRMTLHGATKVPFVNRRILARHLGLKEDAVTLIENDVGGAFGARGEFYPEDFLIPFAARFTGHPVRWSEDRRENLAATNHAREAECELEIAYNADGRIVALRGHAHVDIGAYIRTVGATPARNIIQILSGPYRIPHIDLSVSLHLTNKTPVGTYRGPGRYEADFCRERLFDMIAAELGIDRVEFRRRNLIALAEMPYELATVVRPKIEAETDSGDYAVTLGRCLAEIGWAEKQTLNGRLIDGRYHGLGIGCYFEGGSSGPREHARLAIEPGGAIAVIVGSCAIGQGLETAFAQIAADALEVPIERIHGVHHGSTDKLSEGFGSYSSRSTVMGGSAIVAAANALRSSLKAAAAERLKCAPSAIEIVDARVAGPGGRSMSFAEFAGLSADGVFSSSKRTYSYGAHAAHVAVDPSTGEIEVLDYVAVEDVGRIINPATLHGQTLGAIVQGLGGTLLEHLIYDENGQLVTATLADYLLPTADNFPSIRVFAFEDHPAPHNPLGAKGAGEGGIIPVGGVIANAVAAALVRFNAQPNALPLTPPRVWRLIRERT
jgi:carbon-monoxide dehydrogenase large subunit